MTISARRQARHQALIAHDAPLWDAGLVFAGIDEAGRGPLAGSVFAACAVMPREPSLLWVDDSKKLSEKRREGLHDQILATALFANVGHATPEEIDEMNILEATKLAMRRAAEGCPAQVYLIDAVRAVGLRGRELPIIRGDALSYSIAAASILAKVERDREMRTLDAKYPQYGFARNKGYGTQEHIRALMRFGPCPLHRSSFIGHFV